MSEDEKQRNWFFRLTSGQQGVVVLVVIAVVLGATLTLAEFVGPDGGGSSVREDRNAEDACETFVERRLKAPSSAEFSGTSTSEDGGVWTVVGDVDAENSFGAPIRNDYTCVVKPSTAGDDEWELVDLELAE